MVIKLVNIAVWYFKFAAPSLCYCVCFWSKINCVCDICFVSFCWEFSFVCCHCEVNVVDTPCCQSSIYDTFCFNSSKDISFSCSFGNFDCSCLFSEVFEYIAVSITFNNFTVNFYDNVNKVNCCFNFNFFYNNCFNSCN